MTGTPVVNLFTAAEANISEVMDASWRSARVVTIGMGRSMSLTTHGEEHVAFVIAGDVNVTSADGRIFDLAGGSALSVPLGGDVEIAARTDASVFLLTMAVSAEDHA